LLIDDTEEMLAFFSQRTPTCWGRSPTALPAATAPPLARSETGQSTNKKSIDTVAFINDNVGADSLFDLALADFLLTHGWARRVVFYLKNQPFFVSDAMPEDIKLVIQQLQSNREPAVAQLGDRLYQSLVTNHLSLFTDPFWTSCLSFWELPPALRADLARADLRILKGDVNYRRLLDDRHWPHHTPIEHADANFPRPYLILRTLKGEIMVDLQAGQAETLAAQEPDWLINGKRGIIQVVGWLGG